MELQVTVETVMSLTEEQWEELRLRLTGMRGRYHVQPPFQQQVQLWRSCLQSVVLTDERDYALFEGVVSHFPGVIFVATASHWSRKQIAREEAWCQEALSAWRAQNLQQRCQGMAYFYRENQARDHRDFLAYGLMTTEHVYDYESARAFAIDIAAGELEGRLAVFDTATGTQLPLMCRRVVEGVSSGVIALEQAIELYNMRLRGPIPRRGGVVHYDPVVEERYQRASKRCVRIYVRQGYRQALVLHEFIIRE